MLKVSAESADITRMGTYTRIVLSTVIGGLTISSPAYAAKQKVVEPAKITICHATASKTNPYQTISVSVNSTLLEGHRAHSGDLIPAPTGGCPKKLPTPLVTLPTQQPTSTVPVTPKPTPTPAIDLCPNITGMQAVVPDGYARRGSPARWYCTKGIYCPPPPCGCPSRLAVKP